MRCLISFVMKFMQKKKIQYKDIDMQNNVGIERH